MVLIGVYFIFYGKTSLILIDKGVKANPDYYMNKVLKLVIAKDVPRLSPGREGDMVFNEDSASSHTITKAVDFLNKHKVQNIATAERMPKSPDAVSMNFGTWGILKRE